MTKQEMANVEAWEEAIKRALAAADRSARRARNDALAAIARDIPEPAIYARYMSLRLVEALTSAWQSMSGFRVAEETAVFLRPYGLVEYGGTYLTAFGHAVRRVLIEEDA